MASPLRVLSTESCASRRGGLGADHNRPDFDRTSASNRNTRSNRDGFVEVLGVDQNVAAQLFLGFGEGAVGNDSLAFANANDRCGRGGLQLVAPDELCAQVVAQLAKLLVHGGPVLLADLRELGFILVNQHQVLHGLLLFWVMRRVLRNGGSRKAV